MRALDRLGSLAVAAAALGLAGCGGGGPVGEDSDASVSADGRYVAFSSLDGGLVVGDTGGYRDVFVRDALLDLVVRASVASDGSEGDGESRDPSLSADGRFVAFESEATNLVLGDLNLTTDVFVHDLWTGETTRVSVDSAGGEAEGASSSASISEDGRYVAFESYAGNLVPGDSNGTSDVFLHDRLTGTTTSLVQAPAPAPGRRDGGSS